MIALFTLVALFYSRQAVMGRALGTVPSPKDSSWSYGWKGWYSMSPLLIWKGNNHHGHGCILGCIMSCLQCSSLICCFLAWLLRKPPDLHNLAPGTHPPFLTFNGEVQTDVNKIEEYLEEMLAPPKYVIRAGVCFVFSCLCKFNAALLPAFSQGTQN